MYKRAAGILHLGLIAVSAQASWLSDLTGVNIDLRREAAAPQQVQQVVAAVDAQLEKKFSVAEPMAVAHRPDLGKKVDAVLARLGLPYSRETIGDKTYIACDHEPLGMVRRNVYARAQILISYADDDVSPMIRVAPEERRLRSDEWRKTEDEAIIREARKLARRIAAELAS